MHNGLDRHKNDLMTPICIEMDPRNDISLLEREGVGVKSNYYCPESMKNQMSQVIEKLM